MCLVRIALFSVNAMVSFDVSESVIHEPSTAAMVTITCGAVHQLLLAERDKVSSFDGMLTLQRSCGTKGPATTTLSLRVNIIAIYQYFYIASYLVLNSSDNTFGSPIYSGCHWLIRCNMNLCSTLSISHVDLG